MMHQYVERGTSRVVREKFQGDPLVSFMYSRLRERPAWLFNALTSSRLTNVVAALEYDKKPSDPARMRRKLARDLGIDYSECADDPATIDTPRKSFERKIKFWERRPMDPDPGVIVSPSDSRIVTGSLESDSALYVKDKFFDLDELLGTGNKEWMDAFRAADFAVFRLTPDKYHFNHAPVSGEVRDCYDMEGRYQSCHPGVVVSLGKPFSKNRRTVTIFDTDHAGGTGIGLVAMIEVAALMIGDIAQCYSAERYENPVPVEPGLFVERGCVKSLFRPGSSTVILLFQPGRMMFSDDLVSIRHRADVISRYSSGWGQTLTEADVAVRESIGYRVDGSRQA